MTASVQRGDTASGIDGEVILRPILPVEWPGAITQRPYQASITITDGAGRAIAEVRSGADGRFVARLEPGTYRLHPGSDGGPPQAAAQTVVVEQGRVTPVRIVYDSGIR